MSVYRLAFIGGGLNSVAGYPHFVASRMDARFEVVGGVFSRHEEINRETARYWNVKHVFNNVQDMIDNLGDSLDAVVVLTPTPLHYEHVRICLEKNLKVICEKPLFRSMEEMSRFREFYDPDRHFLLITYNYIAYPILSELRRMIKEGMLGEILSVSLEMPQESFLRPPRSVDYPPWWRKRDGEIPTIILDLASHLFSLSYFLIGLKIKGVNVLKRSFSEFGVVDDVKALIEYENGATGFLWVSKVALGNRNGLRVCIYGSEASSVWVQEDPEKLYISDRKGKRYILDRGSGLDIGKVRIYNRMIAGHPAGYVEALANLYFKYYEALRYYEEHGKLPDDPLLWTFDKELLNFSFMDMLVREVNA